MQHTITYIENQFCAFSLRDTQSGFEIVGADLTDRHNEPRCFTRNKRGIIKQWESILANWSDTVRMYSAQEFAIAKGAKFHTWCAMD